VLSGGCETGRGKDGSPHQETADTRAAGKARRYPPAISSLVGEGASVTDGDFPSVLGSAVWGDVVVLQGRGAGGGGNERMGVEAEVPAGGSSTAAREPAGYQTTSEDLSGCYVAIAISSGGRGRLSANCRPVVT